MLITNVTTVMGKCMDALIGANYFPSTTVVDDNGTPVTNNSTPKYALTAENEAALVDIGTVAKNYTPAFEIVFNTMIEQLGKMVIDNREFLADIPDIWVDPIEWGGFVEWVRVGLSDIMDDPMWNPDIWQKNYNDPVPAGSTDNVGGGKAHAKKMAELAHATYLPRVRAMIFKEAKPIMIALSTYKQQLFNAFKGWDECNEFLSGLYRSVKSTLQLKAKAFAMATICCGIALADKNGHAYNVVKMYHDNIDSTITTVAGAMKSEKFNAYLLEQIANTKDQMAEMSIAYNDGVDPTFTPREDCRVLLNAQYANRLKFGVRANTYNEQLLGIGDYKKVAAWQAITKGTTAGGVTTYSDYDWDAITTVYLDANSVAKLGLTANADTSSGSYTTYKRTGVVAFMYDRLGLGMTLQKETTTTQYSAPEDKVNTFWHGLFNYTVNAAYNMATFYLEDLPAAEAPASDES